MAQESFKSALEAKLNNLLDDDFYTFMHEEFYKLMFKYIPYDTGTLASTLDIKLDERTYLSDEQSMSMGLSSGNINSDGITFNAEYAADIYYNTYGFNFHKEKHPHATEEWGKVALDSEQQSLVNSLNEYLERKSAHEKE